MAQAEAVAEWLRLNGHEVYAFGTGRELMRFASRESADLFLIDWGLPDMSGLDVLAWLRQQRREVTPVIFVTSREAEDDVVEALSAGADDFIVKPIRQKELLSRIEAVLRRAGQRVAEQQLLEVPPYQMDLARRQACMNGQEVELTEKEFDLAVFFFRNIGRLFSRGHLLEVVWGRTANVATRTVDTHISRVRNKLALRPENGFRLTSTYNYGYRLERMEVAPVELGDAVSPTE